MGKVEALETCVADLKAAIGKFNWTEYEFERGESKYIEHAMFNVWDGIAALTGIAVHLNLKGK